MTIRLPDNLTTLVAEATRNLLSMPETPSVSLPKPWSGFHVTFILPSDSSTIFKTFTLQELNLAESAEQKDKKIFLICADLLGGASNTPFASV
ncbi:MAG: hypothetical protein AAB575_04625 [Patescibacteria group bacterium]